MPDGSDIDRATAFLLLNRYTPLSWGKICQMLDRDGYRAALDAADRRYDIRQKAKRDGEDDLVEALQ